MLQRSIWLILAFVIGVVCFARLGVAEDPISQQAKDKDKEKKEGPEPEVPKHEKLKVEKGPLTSAVTLKGTIQSEQTTEFSVKLKTWAGQLIVLKAVEHGAAVKEGDALVEFETDKLDREIRDSRQERELAQVAIKQAEQEIPILEKQAPLDLAAAEREHKQAVEDMKRFVDADRKMLLQSAEFMLKSANFYSEYAKDELKQLQKMYRDKDLTEETEQMILKRYKHSVESAELSASHAKIETEYSLKIELPRREQLLKSNVEKAELNLIKTRDSQPLLLQQKKLALAHLKHEDVKAKEHLAELEADRNALIVRASTPGLAYHGRYVHGQWMVPTGQQGDPLLGVGAVNPRDVFLTVVSAQKIAIRADAEEKELPGLKAGLAGRLIPTAFPDKKIPCEIASVASAPLDGKFEIKATVTGKTEGLLPGMTASLRFVTSRKKEALTVPSYAVFEDTSEDIHYVYLVTKDGKHEKKTVVIGIVSGDKTEIVEGLKEGDEIFSSKP